MVSIHALLAECDVPQRRFAIHPVQFQSTHSLRSATSGASLIPTDAYVSIHALLAECDIYPATENEHPTVSIHALLAECDRYASATGNIAEVSIHALLAECDINNLSPIFIYQKFQSTHSLRSATKYPRTSRHPGKSFNPRTPCGVRRFGALSIFFNALFQSTHSLRSATFGKPDWVHRPRFQSTHSLRSATTTLHNAKAETNVSIHALLAECDRGFCSRGMNFCGFNPRTPCGVRPNPCKDHPVLLLFQSTHSLRSATDLRRDLADMRRVSIHALLAECDLSVRSPLFFSDSFNPRTPCGVRPYNA